MSGKYAELTVIVPVSQYVRVEAAAAEGKRSLESTASFLLSEWVLATQGAKGSGVRQAELANQNRAARKEKLRHGWRGAEQRRGES